MTDGNAGAPPDREELQDLAAWARAVPEALLPDNSPSARYFNRIATILESLSPSPVERREAIAPELIDQYLDDILRYAGSGLAYYTKERKDSMRESMTDILALCTAKAASILALPCPDEAAIREKCAKIADASAVEAVEQIGRNNAYYERSGTRDTGANDVCLSHKVTAEQIAHAIRKGDAR